MILLKNILLNKNGYLIKESKQSIINLGFPEIIASLFYQKFGNKAFTVAKWYKDYYNHRNQGKDWWNLLASFGREQTVQDLVKLYNSTNNPEEYVKVLDHLGLSVDDINTYDQYYLQEQRLIIKKEIEKKFWDDVFFHAYNLIIDIMSGKLKDIKPYENMSFNDAYMKYDEKRIFNELPTLKTYSNGFKWINVGKRSNLVGHYMKNCGSCGVMSGDVDRTMLVLFDSNHKPHAMVTYSPNEKRISGDVGGAHSEIKSEYHDYIIDLTKILDANFDIGKTRSKFLKLKYMLRDVATNFKELDKLCDSFNEYFTFNIGKNKYYSNGFMIISQEEARRAAQAVKNKEVKLTYNLKSMVKNIFNHYNSESLMDYGIKYIKEHEIYDWIKTL